MGTHRQVGLTAGQDGRSSQKRNPLLVTNFYAADGSCYPLGSVNAGASRKDAVYIEALLRRYTDKDDPLSQGLGGYVVAAVLDGAPANMVALGELERQYHILKLRCQSHAISLVLKKFILKVFMGLCSRAVALIQFFRTHTTPSQLAQRYGKLVLLRVIEIRFNTHAMAFLRLIFLLSALKQAILDHE